MICRIGVVLGILACIGTVVSADPGNERELAVGGDFVLSEDASELGVLQGDTFFLGVDIINGSLIVDIPGITIEGCGHRFKGRTNEWAILVSAGEVTIKELRIEALGTSSGATARNGIGILLEAPAAGTRIEDCHFEVRDVGILNNAANTTVIGGSFRVQNGFGGPIAILSLSSGKSLIVCGTSFELLPGSVFTMAVRSRGGADDGLIKQCRFEFRGGLSDTYGVRATGAKNLTISECSFQFEQARGFSAAVFLGAMEGLNKVSTCTVDYGRSQSAYGILVNFFVEDLWVEKSCFEGRRQSRGFQRGISLNFSDALRLTVCDNEFNYLSGGAVATRASIEDIDIEGNCFVGGGELGEGGVVSVTLGAFQQVGTIDFSANLFRDAVSNAVQLATNTFMQHFGTVASANFVDNDILNGSQSGIVIDYSTQHGLVTVTNGDISGNAVDGALLRVVTTASFSGSFITNNGDDGIQADQVGTLSLDNVTFAGNGDQDLETNP